MRCLIRVWLPALDPGAGKVSNMLYQMEHEVCAGLRSPSLRSAPALGIQLAALKRNGPLRWQIAIFEAVNALLRATALRD